MDLTIVVRNLTNMAIDEYKNVRFALTLTALFRFFRPSFQPGLPKSQNFRTFQYHFSHYGVILFWFDLLTVGRVKASAMGVMSTIETLGSSRDWVQSSDWEGRKKLPGLPRKQPTEQAVYWARDGSIPHWSRESPRNRKIQVDGNVLRCPIKMRVFHQHESCLPCPILPRVMKEGESKKAALILIEQGKRSAK